MRITGSWTLAVCFVCSSCFLLVDVVVVEKIDHLLIVVFEWTSGDCCARACVYHCVCVCVVIVC